MKQNELVKYVWLRWSIENAENRSEQQKEKGGRKKHTQI